MNSNLILLVPDGLALTAGNNSFTSNWADKRSAPYFGISVVIRGTGTIAGAITFQASNAIEQTGGTYGAPNPGISGTAGNPDDLITIAGVSLTVSAQGAFQWDPTVPYGFRWVRAVYTATTSAAGQTASVYYNGAFSS